MVLVGVFVGATGVLVLVGVFVGAPGVFVLVGVFVGPGVQVGPPLMLMFPRLNQPSAFCSALAKRSFLAGRKGW